MKIEQINANLPIHSVQSTKGNDQLSFGEILQNALKTVNSRQMEYDTILQRHLLGEDVELHQITIAAEKAKLTLDLTIQIRNKALEAYQEIMRMQV